jgi:hypothetical protein
MRARRRPSRRRERGSRCFHRLFERLRAPRQDSPVHELPADALSQEEIVQLLLERRGLITPVSLLIPCVQAGPDALDDVLNLKPFASIDVPLHLVLDIRILAPIVGVRSHFKNGADYLSHRTWSEARFPRRLQNEIPQALRRFFPDRDLFRPTDITLPS